MSKLTNDSLKRLIKQVIAEAPELQNLIEVGSPQPTDPAQVKRRAAGEPYKVGATLVYPKEWLFKKGPAAVAQVKALVQGGRATIEGFAVQQAAEATLSGEWDALFDMESAADTAASAKAGHASGDTPMPKGSDARDLGGPPASLKPKAKRARGPFSGAAARYYGNDLNGIAKYQSHLNRVLAKHPGGGGASVKVDGKWGKKTRKATSTVQGLLGAKADGTPGSGTFRAIHKFLKPKHATGGEVRTDSGIADQQKARAATRRGPRQRGGAQGKWIPDVNEAVLNTKTQRETNKMINEKQLLDAIKKAVREEIQTLSEVLPGQLSEPVAGGAPSPWPARPGKRAKKKKRVVATRTGKAALRSMAQPGERNWIATLQRLLWPLSQGEQENVAWDPGVSESEFIDGRNGPLTATAVMMFQEDQGITPDGIVGPDTIDRIVAAVGAGEDLPPLEEPGQGVPAVPAPEVDPGSEELVASRAQMRRDGLAESRSPFRKELLEEVCGVPAKRYKIKRR